MKDYKSAVLLIGAVDSWISPEIRCRNRLFSVDGFVDIDADVLLKMCAARIINKDIHTVFT